MPAYGSFQTPWLKCDSQLAIFFKRFSSTPNFSENSSNKGSKSLGAMIIFVGTAVGMSVGAGVGIFVGIGEGVSVGMSVGVLLGVGEFSGSSY